jgi:PAC2 family
MTATPAELVLDVTLAPTLTDPVLLVALTGLFDVAGVATAALDHVVASDEAFVTVGEIDPDPFYDFTVERPTVEVVDDRRMLTWPQNAFQVVRAGGGHDLVVLSGVEPHLAWRTFVECVVTVVDRLGIGLVVTLGSTADVVPHTRAPLVVGSTGDAELAAATGLATPAYEGVTGLVGVLHSALAGRGVPSASLRVGVPHYMAMAEHPRAVESLVRHVAHVIDVPISIDLREAIARWDEVHRDALADDPKLQTYVRLLEAEYDRRTEACVTSGDDLAARFEDYLRASERRPDEDDDV